jgi:XRE family transcriptional regulator, regulator of sulfur utilization
MTILSVALGENLKKIRQQRSLTLDAVSELTEISKSMLGQIERGIANPTLSTLWKLSNGLKVPYSTLINIPNKEEGVLSESDVMVVKTDDNLYENVHFFPFDATRDFEMAKITLKPTATVETGPHPAGSYEFIIVFDGEMVIEHGAKTDIVRKNQAIRFASDVPHKIFNLGKTDVRAVAVLLYQPIISSSFELTERDLIETENAE